MSACADLAASASLGAAPALRAVDCLAGETAASAFGRLFGTGGALLPALTIALTLYIALFALALLTGRSRIGVSALTPRMLGLGLALTFATSWVAYSQVVWNLAVGAPDQIAALLMGVNAGSATGIFADRIDMVFAAIAQAAEAAGQAAPAAAQGPAQGAAAAPAAAAASAGTFSPTGLVWLGAILLLLGTVGVLVTARIALGVLLATGPVFIVLALFSGTRGLTAGWLRGVALTAITPLFVVTGGTITLELLVPVVAGLNAAAGLGAIDARAAMALFLIAAVHVALMAMMLRVAGTMASAWGVFGLAGEQARETRERAAGGAPASAPALAPLAQAAPAAPRRAPPVFASASASAGEAGAPGSPAPPRMSERRTIVTQAPAPLPSLPPLRPRARGIGSRFAAPGQARGMMR